ncbi:hypothetical protein ScPMuIL_017690 [Solemya velum]
MNGCVFCRFRNSYLFLERCSRKFASSLGSNVNWKEVYSKKKNAVKGVELPGDVKPSAVFANNETCLADISVYGFDYDYTLASYSPDLHFLLYHLGQQALVDRFKYPVNILELEYNPEFALRGLHYDIRKGLLMKIDSFHNIQLGSVYRGLKAVQDEEVVSLYDGTHIAIQDMNTFYGTGPMHQMVDLFAPPEMNLISNVTQFFIENNIPYDPEYVFYDVRTAVQSVHSSGLLGEKIMENIGQYLKKGPEVRQVLERLSGAGKKIFLITNSGFTFVDAGMKYVVGEDWMELFDVVIANARKPKFFNESTRPFRVYDPKTRSDFWDRVQCLEKGKVYQQGNFYLLRQMTGWNGSKVLYFGDHVYSDLADPSLKHGWRTGAIIPELENEIVKINSPDFKSAVHWLNVLQELIEEIQCDSSPESRILTQQWLNERNQLRQFTKTQFNPYFGSLFRTYHNPTYFSRRLSRFADLYTSDLVNLLQYSVNHTFYPRRLALPHEPHSYVGNCTC